MSIPTTKTKHFLLELTHNINSRLYVQELSEKFDYKLIVQIIPNTHNEIIYLNLL